MNPWDEQWPLPAQEAAARIARAFPVLAGRPVTFLSQGWDNHVFRCGDDLLVRFPRRDVAVPLLRTEAAVLPLLAPHLPTTIPAAVHWCAEDAHGRPFSVVPWTPGETACRVAPERLDSPELARSLGAFLRCLHAIPVTGALADALPEDQYRRTDFPRRRALVRESEPALRRLLGDTTDPVLAWLDRHVFTPIPPGRTVTHGDLYARHMVLSASNTLAAIIDWGDVHHGCPALDLAVAWSVVPAETRPLFFDAYGPVDAQSMMVARYRALFHACRTLVYADDIGDAPLLQASRRAIGAVLSGG